MYREAVEIFRNHDVRPSVQRLDVLCFMLGHKGHFTAEEVSLALRGKSAVSLCRTTVFSTLKLLASKGILRCIRTGSDAAFFDATMEPHAHFYCEKCGKIHDVPYSGDVVGIIRDHAPEGTVSAELVYTGICDLCNIKQKNSNSNLL